MRRAIFATIMLAAVTALAAEYEGEARKFIKKDIFTCPSTGVSFKAPDLNTKKLQVAYQEATPGITWQLMFAEELGHVAAVTYTKVRKEYPKTDEVLERVASTMKMEAMREGGYLEWAGFLSEAKGKVLQCVIRYPRQGQTVSIRNKWLDSMESLRTDVYEMRHYVVRGDYLIECKLYVPQILPKGSFDEDKLIDTWIPKLQQFVEGCSLIGEKDNYSTQVKEFTRPKSYFRFEFKDPSQG
jgi:hypothetical protein